MWNKIRQNSFSHKMQNFLYFLGTYLYLSICFCYKQLQSVINFFLMAIWNLWFSLASMLMLIFVYNTLYYIHTWDQIYVQSTKKKKEKIYRPSSNDKCLLDLCPKTAIATKFNAEKPLLIHSCPSFLIIIMYIHMYINTSPYENNFPQ